MEEALGLKRKRQAVLSPAFLSPSVLATCCVFTPLFLVWLFSVFLFLLYHHATRCACVGVPSPFASLAYRSQHLCFLLFLSSRCPGDRVLPPTLCVNRLLRSAPSTQRMACKFLLSASCHSRWQPWPTVSLLGSPVCKIWRECGAAPSYPALPFLVNRK